MNNTAENIIQTKWRKSAAAAERGMDVSGILINGNTVGGGGSSAIYENYKNIAIPELWEPDSLVGGFAAAAPEEDTSSPAAKPPVIEGFTQDEVKDGFKKGLDLIISPVMSVVNFNPSFIADNMFVNVFIAILAGPPILELWVTSASNTMGQYVDASGNVVYKSNASASDYVDACGNIILFDFSAGSLNSGAGWFSPPMQYLSPEEQQNAQLLAQAQASCGGGNGAANGANSALLHDALIIKEYVFKTVMLFISFIMTYNWAYLFYSVSNQNDECGYIRELAGINSNASAPLDSDQIIFGIYFKEIYLFLVNLYNKFGPLDYSFKLLDILNWITFDAFAKQTIPNFLDKKIWFMFINFLNYKTNILFFHKYHEYMTGLKKWQHNYITTIFLVIMICFYLTQQMPLMRLIKLIFSPIPTLLTILIINIYLWYCLYWNPFIAFFLIIIFYLIFGLFGITLFPTTSFIDAPQRYTELMKGIEVNASQKYDAMKEDNIKNIILKYGVFILHKIYNNFIFFALFCWMIYLIGIFDMKLEDERIKLNIFVVLMFCMIGLFFMKLLTDYIQFNTFLLMFIIIVLLIIIYYIMYVVNIFTTDDKKS